MASRVSSRAPRIISSPHFWIVVAMFAIGIVFHYPQEILITSFPSFFAPLGLTRHAMERILFLLPITYTGFIFGIRAGLASLAVALIIMLPRVFLVSQYLTDAIFETGTVIITGGLVNIWFEGYRKEKERGQQLLSRLEVAQKELQAHVQVIKENEKRLTALNQISSTVSQSLELSQVLSSAIDNVIDVMQVEIALVFLLDEEAGQLILSAHRGISAEFAQSVGTLKLGGGFNSRVAETGEPLYVEDASEDPRLTKVAVKEEGIRSQLIVPLVSKGKVMGTLCVAVRSQRQDLPEELGLVTAIGNQIGVAVENARLYQQQWAVATKLRASEERYRELFENAYDAIWLQDLQENIIAANKSLVRLTGYNLEELRGLKASDLIAEGCIDSVKAIEDQLLRGEAVGNLSEVTLVNKDQSEASIQLSTSTVFSNGHIIGFQHVARDVTELKRMQKNLRFYLQQATRAQEEERRRIARELHDDTAQDLVAISRRLDSLISDADHLSPQDATLLEELRQQTDRILDGVRRFSQDLRPSLLDDLGLLPALEWLTSDLSQHFGIVIDIEVVGPVRRFTPEAELVLFRIAQEALRNVWKHSGASKAWVSLEFGDDKAVLTVKDNGKGFEIPERVGDLAAGGKLGLAGMEERAQLIGGRLRLQSKPGKGTTVTAEAPI
ncbi:PAS domain S-box protein [Chloroflexota bacterium]